MIPESLIGKIATFYPHPEQVKLGLAQPGAVQLVGQVVAITPASPTVRGNIPDFTVSIKGRSGRTANISLVETYLRIFPDWETAIAATK